MKDKICGVLCVFIMAFFLPNLSLPSAAAEKKVQVYYFYGEGCPHCKKEKAFLDTLLLKYPQMTVKSYEVWYSFENATLFQKMAQAYGKKLKGVPMTFIGHFDPVEGYLNDEITGKVIEERVIYCTENACVDPSERLKEGLGKDDRSGAMQNNTMPEIGKVSPEKDGKSQKENTEQKYKTDKEGIKTETVEKRSILKPEKKQTEPKEERTISLPVIGEVDSAKLSLPMLTIIIGGLDGFNPCAFFVLFLLLSILVYARSRKIMLLVGGIFVFFSGFIYFLFMAAWLNLFLVIGHLKSITIIAGVVAIAIAAINIKDFFAFKRGVSLTISDDAKPKLYERTRNILKKSSLPSMIFATIVLAVVANAYELLCTAGFPMIYTRVLTMNNLPPSQYYLFLALYNTVYILPLASIVLFFSITLGKRKLTEWQGQVLKLMSGVMMLCLGMVLIIKPDLLNNVMISAGVLLTALLTAGLIIYASRRGDKHY